MDRLCCVCLGFVVLSCASDVLFMHANISIVPLVVNFVDLE